jgi:hypothetical protein
MQMRMLLLVLDHILGLISTPIDPGTRCVPVAEHHDTEDFDAIMEKDRPLVVRKSSVVSQWRVFGWNVSEVLREALPQVSLSNKYLGLRV